MDISWRRSTEALVTDLENTIEHFSRLLARRKTNTKADQATIRTIIRAGVMNLRKSRPGSCEPLGGNTVNLPLRTTSKPAKTRKKSAKRRTRNKENVKPSSRSCRACLGGY